MGSLELERENPRVLFVEGLRCPFEKHRLRMDPVLKEEEALQRTSLDHGKDWNIDDRAGKSIASVLHFLNLIPVLWL